MFMIKTCRSARTKAKRRLFSSLPSSEYLSGGWGIWSLTLALCTFLPALSLVFCFTCECEVRQKSQVLQRKVPVMHPKVLMISCPWGPLHTLAIDASWCKWWARRDESSSTHSLRLCCDGGAHSLDAEGTAEDRRHSEVWLIFFFFFCQIAFTPHIMPVQLFVRCMANQIWELIQLDNDYVEGVLEVGGRVC